MGGDSRKAAHKLEKFNCSRAARNWRVAAGGQGVGRELLSQGGASGAGMAQSGEKACVKNRRRKRCLQEEEG